MQIMFLMDARVCQSVRRQCKKAEESIKKKKGQEKEEFYKDESRNKKKKCKKEIKSMKEDSVRKLIIGMKRLRKCNKEKG